MEDFNFDDWAKLYREDPFEFERQRSIVLNNAIAQAPIEHQMTLRKIQEQCDEIHHTLPPLAATIEMSKMLLETNQILQDKCEELNCVYQKHRNK